MTPAFNESREIVATVDFDYPGDDVRDDSAMARQELIIRLLQFVGANATAAQIGQRVLMLAYLVKASDCKTQRQLAKKMGVTPGRVSQALNLLRKDLAQLYRA